MRVSFRHGISSKGKSARIEKVRAALFLLSPSRGFLSRRLEWLFEGDDDAATPLSGDRPRGALVDGRYELVERLGAGAMGVVYRADDVWLGRRVAVKVIAPGRAASDVDADLLKQEARALAKVRHENIVQVYALGPHAGSFYIAMEYVAGQDLEELIEQHVANGTRMDLPRALEIIGAIGLGLQALHERGLVHRDVKPSNIVLEGGTGRPVLVDFGLAAAIRERAMSGGTPCYMAPEQATDDHAAVGPRTDLYALACTAYELFTGRLPFDGDGTGVLLAHLRREPPRLSTTRASLAPFDAVFRRALAKSPDDRQRSCGAFVAELRAAAERIGKRSVTPLTLAPAPDAPREKPLRVVVLEADDALRRQIVRVVDRTLRATGDDVEIEHVLSAAELGTACMREAPDLVVLDEETTNGATAGLVRALGERVGGDDGAPEVLVLRRSFGAPSSNRAVLRAVELPKPLNAHVLASVLSKMAARIVERRRGKAS